MKHKSPSPAITPSPVLPVIAGTWAIAIFVIDTATTLDIAIAVLYVAVVLMSVNFCQRRGILLISLGCMALTVLSFLLSHGQAYTAPSIARCFVSLSAIGITAFLAVKIQSATAALGKQARLLDLTHDTIFVRDTRDVITYWNRGAEELYGWSREQALGKVSHALMQTVFPAPLEDIMADLLHTGRWEGELVHTKRDGTQVIVSSRWSLQRDARGQPVAILETNTDITDRKRAEDALRRSEAYLAEGQRLSITGSFGWKPDGEEIFWSEQTYRIFGFDPATKPNLDLVRERIHPDDITLVEQTFEQAAQDSSAIDLEHRLLMPDGSIKHLHVLARAVTDASNHVELIGAVMDITATKKAQETLQQTQTELAHVMRVTTLGELTASIAHEVNQPLAAIVTNGDAALRWLGREKPQLDEVHGAIRRMIKDANRASEIVQRVRGLSKKTAPEMARLEINNAIYEVVLLMQHQALNHRVSIKLDLASGLPAVFGDRVQLQQVIMNLVINGIEAMSAITSRPRKLVIQSCLDDAGQVLVAVKDFGIGIEPENANQLFRAFYTTKPEGMGMGLSICRSIIEAHGGRVWASTNAGPGATFQFTLPPVREMALQL